MLELGGQPWPESGVKDQVRSVRRHIPKLVFTSERPAFPRIALGRPRSRHRGVIDHGCRLPSASAGVYRRGPVTALPPTASEQVCRSMWLRLPGGPRPSATSGISQIHPMKPSPQALPGSRPADPKAAGNCSYRRAGTCTCTVGPAACSHPQHMRTPATLELACGESWTGYPPSHGGDRPPQRVKPEPAAQKAYR